MSDVTEVLEQVKGLRTLEAVLRWAYASQPPAELVEVITQDEYTHDVIFRVRPDLYLHFDTS